MAHFRATIEGNRGEASRLGTKDSGIYATINGRETGVDVRICHNKDTGKDHVQIIKTNGSGSGEVEKPFFKEWRE